MFYQGNKFLNAPSQFLQRWTKDAELFEAFEMNIGDALVSCRGKLGEFSQLISDEKRRYKCIQGSHGWVLLLWRVRQVTNGNNEFHNQIAFG